MQNFCRRTSCDERWIELAQRPASCPIAGFGISSIEPSGSADTMLVTTLRICIVVP
jgi:hypothetical protein